LSIVSVIAELAQGAGSIQLVLSPKTESESKVPSDKRTPSDKSTPSARSVPSASNVPSANNVPLDSKVPSLNRVPLLVIAPVNTLFEVWCDPGLRQFSIDASLVIELRERGWLLANPLSSRPRW